MFGGREAGASTSDLWKFVGGEWIAPTLGADGPSAREDVGGAYLEHMGELLVFGGRDFSSDTYNHETWVMGCHPVPVSVDPWVLGAASEIRTIRVSPNPFSRETVLRYRLERAGLVRLHVFDPSGRRVAALVDGSRAAGPHDVVWSGRDQKGRRLPPGVYFYRLQVHDRIESGRMVHLR